MEVATEYKRLLNTGLTVIIKCYKNKTVLTACDVPNPVPNPVLAAAAGCPNDVPVPNRLGCVVVVPNNGCKNEISQ